MKTAIVIPARYGSTRFPGKPLVKIGGRTMLGRVYDLARTSAEKYPDTSVYITTDDQRISDHAQSLGADVLITSPNCPTGSDRVLAAVEQMKTKPDFVINLQGDAPFTPPHALEAMLQAFDKDPGIEVVTPVHGLIWADLDRLRESKKTTPFSGTCVILRDDFTALWFSKQIIPAIRDETTLRGLSAISPVYQHLGLYGYRRDILERFCALPQSHYEQLEGLEQLRLLENGITIKTVPIALDIGQMQSGIDTPQDLARAEAILAVQDRKL
jgi:3-deoxy-manno-octulosonate cytidylyltransferase (CMP-KDO synthetase)